MRLITPLGIGSVPGTVPTGNLVWVDGTSGNDSLARRGCLNVAFKTLSAAKTAATSGDTIIVMPGAYSDSNLMKNGVNWHFLPGASVTSPSLALFDGSSGGTSVISGWGVFSGPVEIIKSNACTLTVEALSLTSTNGPCIRCSGSSGKVHVKVAGDIVSSSGEAINIDGSADKHVVEAHNIQSYGYTVVATAGGIHVKAHTIKSDGSYAIKIDGGTAFVIDAFEIYSTGQAVVHNSTGAILTVRGSRIVSTSNLCVWIAASAPNKVRLCHCVLISGHASYSIDAANASTRVHVPGTCANKDKNTTNVPHSPGVWAFDSNLV